MQKFIRQIVLVFIFLYFKFFERISQFVTPSEQERIKGTEKASPYTLCSIGNSAPVIFRIGIKLPRALRGCFVEVPHD